MSFTKIAAAGIGSTETVTIDGLSVINDGSFGGNVSVAGTLTYEDVTNIDSVGLITARDGIVVGSGITLSKDGDIFFTGIMTGNGSGLTGVANTDVIFTDKITLPDSAAGSINVGLGSDLQVYHDGSNSYITNTTGNVLFHVNGSYVFKTANGTETGLQVNTDGAVELYHDNSKKLETASGGVTVTGTVAATSYTGDGSALTGIGGTANVRTGILDVAGIATFRDDVNVPSINGGQIGGRRNLIINGDINIAQRGTSSGSSGYKTVDRFKMSAGGANASLTQAQVDLSSSDTPYSSGFRKAFKITNAGQNANSQGYVYMQYVVEAQDAATSGWNYTSTSSFITVSFWVRASVAQNYLFSVYASDGTAKEYNWFESLSANTWTKITKTMPGDSGITLNNDNGHGLAIYWYGYVGDHYTSTGTVNQWVTHAGYTSRPDMSNTWWITSSSTFQITGVQLEVGSQATPFEHRNAAEELALCHRYYEGVFMNDGTASMKSYASYGGSSNFEYQMKAEKRARPTFSLEGDAGFSGATPNAYESTSSVAFQVNNGTLFALGDGVDELSASFDAELD